jgi:hypothetical protein
VARVLDGSGLLANIEITAYSLAGDVPNCLFFEF